MDSICITVLFVYLIIATGDFYYLCKRGDETSSLLGNFFESFLWPVVFPLMAIFYVIVLVFELVLFLIRYTRRRYLTNKRNHNGH